MKLVTFRIDHELYAVAVEAVRSIEKVQPIRPVPHAPEHVVGIMNLRGVVMTVADLRSIMHFPLGDFTEDTRLMVIGQTAFVVDEALDVQDISEDQLEMRDEISDLVLGIVQNNDQLVVVINDQELAAY